MSGELIKLSSAALAARAAVEIAVVEVAVVDVAVVVAALPEGLTDNDRGEVGGLFELIIKTPVKKIKSGEINNDYFNSAQENYVTRSDYWFDSQNY